ncbi:two-component system response regulator YesN [Halanaerobium saccharolyticum]|uniref:Stage 0 sporulation protein A homolog n=1 Tax=Halanaerobium saccharolyticum TaxID=43595 RepID=A0A4R7YX65_9FIRM|nr:response regulator [Halanaerobium saccharolyticum]RAK08996.1 two-component system response regulator YesN [Halanaerobium saccharolyticum]TDW02610.1 two-component system response regulator YesN [Halanaerobium saccharolyticum]TDX60759.1 two-component system response regulator YesN [Halanaerobium saccharolyticum]
MIRLLIAEDEHLERKAIKFFINKLYQEEIKVVAEVSNGQEAVFQALENKVDLVLMDIKMPKLDGLEAAARLKEEKPEIEIIILTAHSEFDYARKSIKIGVSDYLVKPYVEADFKEVVDKAIQKIREQKKENEKEQRMLEKIKNITPVLEKESILNIVYNTQSSLDNFLEHKKMLGIKGSKYFFMTVNYEDNAKINDDFYNSVKKKLKKIFTGVISYNGLINSIFLIIDDNLNSKINSQQYQEVKKLIKNKPENTSGQMYIKSSNISSDFSKISDIYNQTKDNTPDTQYSINNYPYQNEKKVFAKIIDKNKESAKKEFNEIYNYLLQEEKCNFNKIKSFLRRFLVFLNRRLMEYYNEQQPLLEMQRLENEIKQINNLEGLKNYFEQLIDNLIDELHNNANEKKVEIIETVKDYIRENYSEDISLDDVADYISFSKYYLSKLFKEVEGINYKDYLIKVRMEEAKKRLKNGDKIKVVAGEVGYSDRNYFSRAFKKYTGISPGKFQ